jgi:hypothetical protein
VTSPPAASIGYLYRAGSQRWRASRDGRQGAAILELHLGCGKRKRTETIKVVMDVGINTHERG